jgi:hypothetical protein
MCRDGLRHRPARLNFVGLGVTEGTRTPDLQGHNLSSMTVIARASPVYDGGDLQTPSSPPMLGFGRTVAPVEA